MKRLTLLAAAIALLASCTGSPKTEDAGWNNSVIYELNTRQFTPEGTFKAAEDQLPRLKEQGVDVVWMMPLYPIGEKGRKGTLGSYYAIKDYCATNPEFGTLEDFDSFVAKAHQLGMKVILDWVANHTSPDHAWVTEKPAEWYYRDENGNTVIEYDWTDIAKLNYGCEGVREAMLEAMRFWVARGVDGFRCDMASLVPEDFWTPTIATLREEAGKPLFFLAEAEEDWMHRAGFDAMYAWRFHHLINDIAQGSKGKAELLEEVQTFVDAQGRKRLCFTSNHDENSWAGTEFERMGEAWQAMSILCWTLPNSLPLIYTGQEAGLSWRFKFFEKDEAPHWGNGEYAEFYRYLSAQRHSHPALDADAGFELLESGDDEIRFIRRKAGDEVLVSVQLKAPWKWSISSEADRIERVEPMCWWTGMKTPLQLLVQGEGIGEWNACFKDAKGVRVTGTHKADSPNYLFVDVEIAAGAQPGTYRLHFSKGEKSFSIPYELLERREGSAERKSFTSADLMYLIMPDRFVNGNPYNDNSAVTTEKADPKAFFGRHGGDIAGISSQLGYLEDLGVTAIWNTPLLEDNVDKESYHGYACTDYYHIDSRFGSNEEYRELVRDAHEHGIKMIMDIVTNHCGNRHWWMEDLPFKDWIHVWPEYTHSNCCFSAQNDPYVAEIDRYNMESGWFDTSMPDMNLDNPYLLQYFKQWAVWWIEWADLDGFRVDTYPYNEKYPMSEWCASILEEYPDFNIVGEVWSNNVPQVAYWQAGNPNRDGFNSNLPAIMDFPLQTAFCQALSYHGKVNWDEGLVKVYDCVANDQYYHDKDNMLIFTGNHDQERIADCLGKDAGSVKNAFALLATLRGIPQVLYADEVFAVSKDRSQGHGGLRVDFPLEWEKDPQAKDMHDYFKALFNWRKGCEAVHNGELKHFLRRDNTYAMFRIAEKEKVFVFVNNTEAEVQVPWADYSEIGTDAQWFDVITGQAVDPAHLSVAAKSNIILQTR